MSAASPEGTLTVDRPQSGTVSTAPSRRSFFVPLVWLLLVAQLSWGVAGVVLAMLGVFSLTTLLPSWGVLAVALWIATRSARRAATGRAGRSTPWIRAAAVAVAAAAVVVNGAFPGEHMQTGRDGGTYTATAGWIATHGGLVMDVIEPPFDDSASVSEPGGAEPTGGLGFDAAGFHSMVDDGPLYAQFMHIFPAMMATVDLAAGLDWMVRTNALIGGLALLAFYAFGERITRPWAALVAQLALAVSLVFFYFTRAPFSELLTMGMLFAGLWALDQAVAQRSQITGFVAGLFLGGTFLARLDGLVVVLMVILALLPPIVSGRLRRVAPAALSGVAASCALAVVDLFVFSPFYVHLHVQFLVPLGLGFIAAGVIAALARTSGGRAATRAILRHRRLIARTLAALIVSAGVLAYVVRPSFIVATWNRTTPIGVLQQMEGEAVNEARTYAEHSAHWLGWYMGVPALAVTLCGWAAYVHHALARRSGRLAPFLLSLSGVTTLYVWMPSITPDHIWAARRFLPVIIPGLLLCAAWLLARTWRAAAPWRLPARAATIVAAILLVVGALGGSARLAGLHEQAGMAGDVARACAALGDDAAILLLDEPDSAMHYRMTHPLRAHCGVPAAWTSTGISDERLVDLAERADGRTLYLLAEHPESFEGRPVGDVFTLLSVSGVQLEQTLTAPPRQLRSYGLGVLAAPVMPASAAGTG
jgi:hypothetical protein